MQGELQTLLRCGIVAGFGGIICYLMNLAPMPSAAKQALNVGVIMVAIGLMLRIGGVL